MQLTRPTLFWQQLHFWGHWNERNGRVALMAFTWVTVWLTTPSRHCLGLRLLHMCNDEVKYDWIRSLYSASSTGRRLWMNSSDRAAMVTQRFITHLKTSSILSDVNIIINIVFVLFFLCLLLLLVFIILNNSSSLIFFSL